MLVIKPIMAFIITALSVYSLAAVLASFTMWDAAYLHPATWSGSGRAFFAVCTLSFGALAAGCVAIAENLKDDG